MWIRDGKNSDLGFGINHIPDPQHWIKENITLHYITRNLLPKIITTIQSITTLFILYFLRNDNISCNSSMTTAILPFRGFSGFFRCIPSSAQHMKNRVNGSICVKWLLLRYQFFRQVSTQHLFLLLLIFKRFHATRFIYRCYYFFNFSITQTFCDIQHLLYFGRIFGALKKIIGVERKRKIFLKSLTPCF